MSFNNSVPPDPIESITKGTVKAVIDLTSEKINEYIEKFRNRKIAFVDDPSIIENIKKQREKGEWKLFTTFIKDPKLHILFQTGLTLRDFEEERKNMKPLLDKIYKKYDLKGIHVAWFAQNGLFGKYCDYLFESGLSMEDISKEINQLFKDIDNRVFFIRKTHGNKIRQVVGEIVAKIHTFNPNLFIISSIGGASGICERITISVHNKIKPLYDCESYHKKRKKIFFLVKRIDYEL